ncbi:hypothetical protein ACP4OV_021128 [Aristida adscensionis]
MVSLREMARADALRAPPAWLQVMLTTTFFGECPEHHQAATGAAAGAGATRTAARSTTACNFFCTECSDLGSRALCAVCVAAGHSGHSVLQIRKSTYHYVVRVRDVARLLDVSEVQTYMINGDSVVYLNPRPVTGQGKPRSAARCDMCERGIQDTDCRFCSLGCKLEAMDGDFDVSFAVPPRSDSETSSDDDDASRSTNKLRRLANLSVTGNEGAGGKVSGGGGGGGAGTSGGEPPPAPAAPEANNPPPAGRRRSRKGVPVRAPFS